MPEALLALMCGFWLYLMYALQGWEALPFHFIYVGVGIMYGLRMWPVRLAIIAIALVAVTTGALTVLGVLRGSENTAELVEVPLMSLIYLTMVIHVNSRQRMVGVLARLREDERRLYAYASHELMTPLTVARGELELLDRYGSPSEEELASAHGIVLEELRRSEALVGDMLLAARVNFSGIQPHLMDADELVLGAAERWMGRTPGPLLVDDVACGSMLGSRDDLTRVLDNLIGNAARHTEAGQAIRLASRRDGDTLLITVTDEGSGIAAEDLPHVFEQFYRSEEDRRVGKRGTGLGLAIVKDVVEAHGGAARIMSEPGLGTSVTIDLPVFVEVGVQVSHRMDVDSDALPYGARSAPGQI